MLTPTVSVTDLPSVACIVVNWNNFPDTDACLTSLAAQDYSNLHVIVIDNASTDGSLERLRATHPSVSFIANPLNAGFPAACNIGARHPLAASAEFLWLLNNDTIAPPCTTGSLVAAAQANPAAGVIGAVLYYLDDPGSIQAWGGGAISPWTGYNTHYTAPTPFGPNSYITFASALIPRQAWDHLDGLFEGAFMYFEDSDFCFRARAAGWQLAIAAGTAILHKEGGSAKNHTPDGRDTSGNLRRLNSTRRLQKDRIITTAGLLFLGRHAPVPLIARTLFFTSRLAKRLLSLDLSGVRAVCEGARDWHRRS